MTTGHSPQLVKKRLESAEVAQGDAAYLLNGGRFLAAANRAYYAMFHAAMAALGTTGARLPKTRSGTISQFGEHFIKTGRLDQQFGRALHRASDLRLDYST